MARLQLQFLRCISSFSNLPDERLVSKFLGSVRPSLHVKMSTLALPLINHASSSVREHMTFKVTRTWNPWKHVGGERAVEGVRTISSGDCEIKGERIKMGGWVPHLPAPPIDGGKKYSVVEINKDGSWRTVSRNAEDIGIHPRDIYVLVSGNPFISQRSTIEVHNEKVMVRMENVRALLCKDYVLLFEAHRPRLFEDREILVAPPSIENSQAEPERRSRELFADYMAQQAPHTLDKPLGTMPFHLRMMECLLVDTSTFYYQRARRLKTVVERTVAELNHDVNIGGLQRLLPLRRALTAVEQDVRDTHLALEQVLKSDEDLEALCLHSTELQSPSTGASNSKCENGNRHQSGVCQAAADMIVTYQRQIDNAGGALEELRKNMDATQEIWELGLDTTRNRIIQMELLFSLGTLALSMSALVTSYFGMNLFSGYKDHPDLFWWVIYGTTTSTFVVASIFVFLARYLPRRDDKRRAQELQRLRCLLQRLDDIDHIFQAVSREVAGRAVSRPEFKEILRSHPTAKSMPEGELDLLFRMFDTNRDGVLEAGND